mmetsp:Transcript_18191/g.29583  ORF Transcript_18191/g.29583 Transcript_18191/m.29583 type:complete len:269 (-) Transcript_18191:39-845(-)
MTSLSVREMKDAMLAAGVSFADCTEKSELVARYQSMMARSAGRPNAKAQPSRPAAKEVPSKPKAQAPPRQLRVEEMGRTKEGKDGGEIGAEIRRIFSCKDFYEILVVPRSCNENDLKKAYRKLAIKLHPDKCHLTGAEDAFKKVSTAFSCLNDSRQRSAYDVGGEDAVKPGGGGHSAGFRGDVDAEELFRAFCGGGGIKVDNIKAAVQKNPWVLLVALTMLSNVIHLLEALLSNPILLALPVVMWLMCPPHVRKNASSIFARFLMRAY